MHLMGLFEEAQIRIHEPDLAGFRLSYGLSGLLLKCKVFNRFFNFVAVLTLGYSFSTGQTQNDHAVV